jgi:hypothetical protein
VSDIKRGKKSQKVKEVKAKVDKEIKRKGKSFEIELVSTQQWMDGFSVRNSRLIGTRDSLRSPGTVFYTQFYALFTL